MKSILDPSFQYRSSVDTDIRATFARVRRDLRKQPRGPALSRRLRVIQRLRQLEMR